MTPNPKDEYVRREIDRWKVYQIITWTDRDGGRHSVGSTGSQDHIRELCEALGLALRAGWTAPRWWQWWRWGDWRPNFKRPHYQFKPHA